MVGARRMSPSYRSAIASQSVRPDAAREAYRRALELDAAPGLASRSLNAIQDFLIMLTEIRSVAVNGTPSEILEAVLDKTGYLRELEASHDPQDEGRVDNLRELVSVAREFEEQRAGTAEAGDLARQVDADTLDAQARRAPRLPGESAGVQASPPSPARPEAR